MGYKINKLNLVLGLFALFIALSGLFTFHYESNVMVNHKNVKAIVLSLGLLFVFLLLAMVGVRYSDLLRLPKVVLFSIIFYSLSIIFTFFNFPFSFIGQFVKFLSFLAFFSFFYFYVKKKCVFTVKKSLYYFVLVVFLISVFWGSLFYIVDYGLNINGAFRVGGNVGSPVGYAALIAICSLTLLALVNEKQHYVFNIYIYILLALIVIYFSGTRSILLGIFLFVAFSSVIFSKRKFLLFSLLTSLLVVLFIFHLDDILNLDVVKRYEGILSGDISSDSSTLFRVFIVETLLSNFSPVYFLFGIGSGGFPMWFESKTGISDVAPHFEVIWILVEFGLIGFLFYLFIIFYSIFYFYNGYKKKLLTKREFIFLFFILCSQMTLFQFANPFYFYQFGLVYFAILGFYFGRLSIAPQSN